MSSYSLPVVFYEQSSIRKNCLSPAKDEMSTPAGAPPDPGNGFYSHISCHSGESLCVVSCLLSPPGLAGPEPGSTGCSVGLVAAEHDDTSCPQKVACRYSIYPGFTLSPFGIFECSYELLFIALLVKLELQSPLTLVPSDLSSLILFHAFLCSFSSDLLNVLSDFLVHISFLLSQGLYLRLESSSLLSLPT